LKALRVSAESGSVGKDTMSIEIVFVNPFRPFFKKPSLSPSLDQENDALIKLIH
jgi:hypothetical protein